MAFLRSACLSRSRPTAVVLAWLLTIGGLSAAVAGNAPVLAAQEQADPQVVEAARLTQQLQAELSEKFPESGVEVEVQPLVNETFGVFFRGTVDPAKKAEVVDFLSRTASHLKPGKVRFYQSDLKAKAPAKPKEGSKEPIQGERVQLHYQRDTAGLAALLTALAAQEGSTLKGTLVREAGGGSLVLSGTGAQRETAKQIVAALDLPLPAVHLEMWGVQLSSSSPDRMAEVLRDAQVAIGDSRGAVKDTLQEMQSLAARVHITRSAGTFADIFTNPECGLGYQTALQATRTSSLVDILLRLIASDDPGAETACFANDLTAFLRKNYRSYVSELPMVETDQAGAGDFGLDPDDAPGKRQRLPFEAFFRSRGLTYNGEKWEAGNADAVAYGARAAVLRFAVEYRQFVRHTVRHPDQDEFNPYRLQQSSGDVTGRLQATVDALTSDMYALFIRPTLEKIRKRVGKSRGVEYAQVGRTSVASLSGTLTTVSGKAKSFFNETPPLRLSEVLDKATELQGKISPFVPKGPAPAAAPTPAAPAATPAAPTTAAAAPPAAAPAATPPAAAAAAALIEPLLGGIPYSQIIGLIGAFGEQEAVWRELATGVSISVTPTVLRNAASAELNVDLTVGDPLVTASEADKKIKPLSRVTEHKLNTKVYINSLDIFDLSTFSSQVTRAGRRGQFPIVGPIWNGIFGDVPVLGSLFSWKRGPRNVYHQSVILANSIINPTAMGVALLYPLTSSNEYRLTSSNEAADSGASPGNAADRKKSLTYKDARDRVELFIQEMEQKLERRPRQSR